jgi:hypothetical protein
MTKFESIFDKDINEVDQSLDKLFKRKRALVAEEEKAIPDLKGVKEELKTTPEIDLKKKKKRDPEEEKRTVFVGNLNVDCKKEVHTSFFRLANFKFLMKNVFV